MIQTQFVRIANNMEPIVSDIIEEVSPFDPIDYVGSTLNNTDEMRDSTVKCLNDGTLMKFYFTGNGPDDYTSHLICPICKCIEDE